MENIAAGTGKILGLEEEMIGLFHNLESLQVEQSHKVIQFVASHTKEGVSTISLEFARVSSQIFGKSVLLLVTNQKLTQIQNQKKTDKNRQHAETATHHNSISEVTDLEKNEADIDLDSIIKNKLLPYHTESGEPQGFYIGSLFELGPSLPLIFSKDIYARYLERLRDKFDIVVIDAPPICESTVGLASCAKTDGVILVVAAESTRWPVVVQVKERIEKVGGKLLGVVLNKQKHYIPSFIYNHFL